MTLEDAVRERIRTYRLMDQCGLPASNAKHCEDIGRDSGGREEKREIGLDRRISDWINSSTRYKPIDTLTACL